MKRYLFLSLFLCFLQAHGQSPKMYKISIVPFFREQTLSDLRFFMDTDICFKVKKQYLRTPHTTRPVITYDLTPKKKQLKNKYFLSINISGYKETERNINFVAENFYTDFEHKDTLSPLKKEKIIISHKGSELLVLREGAFRDGKYVFTFYIKSLDNFQTIPKEKLIKLFLDARIEEYYRSP